MLNLKPILAMFIVILFNNFNAMFFTPIHAFRFKHIFISSILLSRENSISLILVSAEKGYETLL
jgi:hypothetical protein